MKIYINLPFLIIFYFLFIININIEAQIKIGVHGGMSVPNLRGGTNEVSQGYSSRFAPSFGVFGEYELNNNFYLNAGINFDGQGGQRNGVQPITSTDLPPLPSGGYYYANFKNVSILNYLEIPVTLKYLFGNSPIKYFIDAGPYVGFLLNAKEESSGVSSIYIDKNGTLLTEPVPPTYQTFVPVPPQSFDATTDVYSSLHKVNAGITGGVGVSFKISNYQNIIIELKGLYGLTNIQKFAADGKSHTGNLIIDAGYALGLN